MNLSRPSRAELEKKVVEAISAINSGNRSIPYSKHFTSDQDDLGIEDTKDLWPLLVSFLEEIKSLGASDCYAGGRPPQRSYEVAVEGKELWAYSWSSKSMDKQMYIKFCLVKGNYFYMGCHESKPKGEKR